MTEIYKIVYNLSPDILNDIFSPKTQPYNLRNNSLLQLPKTNSVTYGLN